MGPATAVKGHAVELRQRWEPAPLGQRQPGLPGTSALQTHGGTQGQAEEGTGEGRQGDSWFLNKLPSEPVFIPLAGLS